MNNSNIGFFFGAGAELCYGLPGGEDFTVKTICRKRTKMYQELKSIYENHEDSAYVGAYSSDFHFRTNSAAFKEIVNRAIYDFTKDNKITHPRISRLVRLRESKSKMVKKIKSEIEAIYNDIYEKVVLDSDGLAVVNEEYEFLIEHFKYYGAIEKDFSTISNPKNAGEKKFWALINYFWSTYMAIVIPLMENSLIDNEKSEFNKNKYEYILSNLKEMLDKIYSSDFIDDYPIADESSNYYPLLKDMNPKCVLTTNYTPFINQFETENKVFLAGELKDFEVPSEFIIDEFKNINNKKIFFPYMLTQAPIKPIIHPKQIQQYAKAIKCLSEIDILIVLGYSINESDDHINAMLNDFLRKGKRIIYCNFLKENDKEKNEEDNKKEVCKRLHISPNKANVSIIDYRGDATNIKTKIIDKIELKLHKEGE